MPTSVRRVVPRVMEYSMDGRSRSDDRNVNKDEPYNPDQIADFNNNNGTFERPHIKRHRITNVAKVNADGSFTPGIEDTACVGCHQGSNRTVLQYWGIRLDQNEDVVNNNQYPQNPDIYRHQDVRLFDPSVTVNGVVQGNNTFNGRNAQQYLLYEDYDGDGRDDTPPDVHYEVGLGVSTAMAVEISTVLQAIQPAEKSKVDRIRQRQFSVRVATAMWSNSRDQTLQGLQWTGSECVIDRFETLGTRTKIPMDTII